MPDPKEENLHKEIDLIQGVIARLAQNAYYIKGWSITLVSIVLALGKDDLLTGARPAWLLSFVLVIWLAFWYLDAYFLRQERLFRLLYKYVITHKNDPARLRYDLDLKPFVAKTDGMLKTMGSATLRVFYGLPALLLLGIWIYFLTC